ncbi:cytochrome b/b6 domain-containing protein [Microbacterium sp. NPDC090218]
MATRMLRRGLPRVPGGDPWPPADAVAVEAAADAVAESSASSTPDTAVAVDAVDAVDQAAEAAEATEAATPAAAAASAAASADASGAPAGAGRLRRGLPRVPGGEPWPPVDAATVAPPTAASLPAAVPESAPSAPAVAVVTAAAAAPAVATSASAQSAPAGGVRRGLPRVIGGEPWPPADTVPVVQASAAPVETVAAPVETVAVDSAASAPAPASAVAVVADVDAPLAWTRTVWNGRAPRHVAEAPAPERRRPTWTQAIAVLFGAAALGVLAGAAIAFVRTLLSFPFMQDFLAAFPGEYEPAIAVEPGFAPWIGWQHFFNVFLMVLIIRSGLQVRTEKRPTVFWTPRGDAKGKISLNLWFHQSLDILWLVNGVIFVVLLFVTGHWVRIVPTSWEVFPNALSAALQYVSFDWPHENGWNNYNSLQQLAYFATVFLAAPLAAISGFRMSGLWPKKAEKLSKAYPVEWARALHFPIMLYFVAFIIAHVALVMLTGFLRNLNHMFASQDAVTWTGFWVFVASLVVIAIAWVAARPLVLAPIAKVFGKVSGR